MTFRSRGRWRVRPVPDRRAGYTLVELLVTLVISGIVVGALFQALLGQGRFARYIGAREEVQQNARVGVEMISSELRGVLQGGIVQAEPHRLRFRVPRAWGILCNGIARGAGAQAAWVRFPAGMLPSSGLDASRGWGVAVAQTANPSIPPGADEWRTASPLATTSTVNVCVTNLGAAANVEERGFSATGLVPPDSPAPVVPPGSMVALFEEVTYDTGEETGTGARWVRRSVAYSVSGVPDLRPLVGPLPGEESLLFRYFDAQDGEIAPPTLLTQAGRDAIASIRVTVATQSTARFSGQPQVDSASTRVVFRNR
jgi:prepilin-type N-terminal cleavage/methylation domain-containing protein